jgi:predicted transposase YdaD
MGGMMKMINEIERKGIEKGKIETAIEMLKLGAEIAFVQKYTKLSIEKVKELQNTIKIK